MQDDSYFYTQPRKVVHIDDGAITALRAFYGEVLKDGGIWLDMMSSWRSHLPEHIRPARVDAIGMNAAEMADNPQLDTYRVHNLNQNPSLPFDKDSFDAVLCAVSVQYLTQPISVFRDIQRVLRPGGIAVMSFSNRCFPTKAVALWLAGDDAQHVKTVSNYFDAARGFISIEAYSYTPARQDPLHIVSAHKASE